MQISTARQTATSILPAATEGRVTQGDARDAQAQVVAPQALDRFVPSRDPQAPAVTVPGGTPSARTGGPVTTPLQANPVIDLGAGSERGAYSKTADLYSGAVTASLINQRGPMTGSHTSSRETAVTALEFTDQRGFFGGAASVEVELVPQHTLIDRSSMGGHLTEQRRAGVLDESQAVRVRLERGSDGTYRASAPDNKGFFVTSSEVGYARRVLEDIKISVIGAAGVEDTAYGARYGLL